MYCGIWIIIIAFLVGINASLIGTFLMLRKQAMLGDAISHAILLGVVMAFLVTGSTHLLLFLIGALIAAIACIVLIKVLQNTLKIDNDSAIGIIFTSFFALGVILITRYTQKVDLDQGCVLYGQIIGSLFNKWNFYGYILGPQVVYWLLAFFIINGLLIWLNYPTLLFITFDPVNAKIMGINVKFWEYMLMLAVGLVAVISFRIVGAPLMVAFLAIPPATAYLLTNQVSKMIFYAFMVDGIASIYGYQLALAWNTSIPGSIVIVASALFGFALIVRKLVQKK